MTHQKTYVNCVIEKEQHGDNGNLLFEDFAYVFGQIM